MTIGMGGGLTQKEESEVKVRGEPAKGGPVLER